MQTLCCCGFSGTLPGCVPTLPGGRLAWSVRRLWPLGPSVSVYSGVGSHWGAETPGTLVVSTGNLERQSFPRRGGPARHTDSC